MPSTLCNPKLIEDFLAERLTEDQREEFEQHLDDCDACCAALQLQTADVNLWNDARNYLSTVSDLLGDSPDEISSSADPPRLDFLAPTDDPHMLGRFAGYEVCGVIGCGGMGIVLKGFDSALNRYAAIKVLSPHYASSGAARQRFAREAQAAAAVVHDNVIAIHGVDEFNGLPYLVMPYIKGQSLQTRIQSTGSLSIEEVLRVGLQTARGLAAAHDQGLVHRDIKPGNILLPVNVERVIITDFGLARAADDASLTRSGVIAGTPQYMSPEQARGEAIDHRSDLFSLGSMMYAMCTGHAPFRAETPYGILRRITDNEARPIRDINPGTPAWLESIIQKLLSKSADDRYSTAADVAGLLEDCLAHVQHPTQVPLPKMASQYRQQTAVRKWNKVIMVFAGVCLCLLVANAIHWQNIVSTWAAPDKFENATAGDELAVVQVEEPGEASDSFVPDERKSSAIDEDLSWDSFDDLDQLETTIRDLNRGIQDE